jgi:hypothetical protein
MSNSIDINNLKDQGFGEEGALEALVRGTGQLEHAARTALENHTQTCDGDPNSIFNRSVVDGKCVDKLTCESKGGIFVPWNIDFQQGVYQFPQCYSYHENELHPSFYVHSNTQYMRIGYLQRIGKWCLEIFSDSINPPEFSTFSYREATGQGSFQAYARTSRSIASYTVSLNTGGGNIPDLGGKTYNTRQITNLLKEASEGNMRSFSIVLGLIRGNLRKKYGRYPLITALTNSIPLSFGQLVSGRQSLQHYIDNYLPLRDPRTQKTATIRKLNKVSCLGDCGNWNGYGYVLALTNYTVDKEALAGKSFDELLTFWSPQARDERAKALAEAEAYAQKIIERTGREVSEDPLDPSRGGGRSSELDPEEGSDADMLSRISQQDFVPPKKSNRLRNTLLIGSAVAGSVMYMRYRRNR